MENQSKPNTTFNITSMMNQMSINNNMYTKMNLPPFSSRDQIKKQYKSQALKMHPDKLQAA